MLPFSLAFGYSRAAYIAAVAVCYLVPAAMLTAYAAHRIVSPPVIKAWPFAAVATLAMLFEPYWSPTLFGFPDIAGLVALAAAYLVVRETRFGARLTPATAILLGILIWMPFLMRRWYAFSIVALALTSPVYSLTKAVQEGSAFWRSFVVVAANYAIAGIVATALAFWLQQDLVLRILQTNYAEIYAAYQLSTADHYRRLLSAFGLIYLGLAVVAHAIAMRNRRMLADILFVDANIVVLFLLFTHTQQFGVQHYIPLAFWICILALTAVYSMLLSTRNSLASAGVVAVASGVFIATYFLPQGTPRAGYLFPEPKYPVKLANSQEYQRLVETLLNKLGSDGKFAVFGSQSAFTRDMFISVSSERLAGKDIDISHVDLMQGPTITALLADYAVVTDPPLTHLPSGQNVVTIPTSEIFHGRSIGAAYEKLPEAYSLAPSITAFIYKRTRPFTVDEVRSYMEAYYTLHPDWRTKYPLAVASVFLTSRIKLGDTYGQFQYQPDGSVLVQAGATSATELYVPQIANGLRAANRATCEGADGIQISVKTGDQTILDYLVPPLGEVALPDTVKGPVTITVSKNGNPWCDWLTLSQ